MWYDQKHSTSLLCTSRCSILAHIDQGVLGDEDASTAPGQTRETFVRLVFCGTYLPSQSSPINKLERSSAGDEEPQKTHLPHLP